MKRTINVNIGGYAFHIEEDAYETLSSYLETLEKAYSADTNKKEIMSDIENRLGEILTEQKGGGEVIDLRMVALAKERIGAPEELEQAEQQDNPIKETRKKRHLYRDIDRNTFGGVCTGLGHYFDIDAVWIKLGFTLVTVCGAFCWDGQISWISILSYLILWLCLPAAKTIEQKCEMLGEPMKIVEYKDYMPTKAARRGSYGSRILGTIAGIFLLLWGFSMLAGSVAIPFCSHLVSTVEIKNEILYDSDIPTRYAEVLFYNVLCNTMMWWIVFAAAFIFSLLLVYEGIVLCFKIKRPSWHPGLILLILWFASLIVLIGYIAYQFNPITTFPW